MMKPGIWYIVTKSAEGNVVKEGMHIMYDPEHDYYYVSELLFAYTLSNEIAEQLKTMDFEIDKETAQKSIDKYQQKINQLKKDYEI
jgi:hypothetical protein